MDNRLYNLDAEKGILAAMMRKGVAEKYIKQLTPEDFYDRDNQRIYMGMQALYISKSPIDLVTMSDMLLKQNDPKVADDLMSKLLRIFTNSFGAEFAIREYISMVRDASNRRKFCMLMNASMERASDTTVDLESVVSDVQSKLRGYHDIKGENVSLQTVLLNAFNELEDRSRGVNKGMPSGVEVLDAKTAGFHRGEMTIIGARPAVGKSALACQIAIGAGQSGNKVCICSREMTDVQYGIRILARGTRVSNMRMRTGELTDDDWGQLADSSTLYTDCDVSFMFATKAIEDLVAEVRAMKESKGLDMLIVDYIQLLQSRQRFEKDYQRIGYISKALKDMSIDFDIAVIALAQVGRSADNSMPTLSELRGSGDLEQDADNVIFLHRPEDQNDKWVRPSDKSAFNALRMMKQQYLVMNIAKQRQGETGAVACAFDPAGMIFKTVKG